MSTERPPGVSLSPTRQQLPRGSLQTESSRQTPPKRPPRIRARGQPQERARETEEMKGAALGKRVGARASTRACELRGRPGNAPRGATFGRRSTKTRSTTKMGRGPVISPVIQVGEEGVSDFTDAGEAPKGLLPTPPLPPFRRRSRTLTRLRQLNLLLQNRPWT